MMFKTHLAFAVLVGILILYYLKPSSPIIFSLVFLFSSVLPDIDTGKSVLGRRLWPLSSILNFLFGHRGFLHTLWVPLILLITLYYFSYPVLGFAVFAGYSLHLVVDALSAEGVKLFSPLWKRHFRGFIKTGGLAEHFVLLAVCIGIGLLVVHIGMIAG